MSNRFGLFTCTMLLAASAFAQDGLTEEKRVAAADKPSAGKATSIAKQASDEKAIELLRQMEARYAQVQTVSGVFKQTRIDKGFGDTIESQAEFSLLKPNKFRADYKAPYESTNLITDDSFYRYTKAVNQVEQYKFQGRMNVQDLNYMLLGFGAKVENITNVYNVKWLSSGVAPGYYGIQLTPRDTKDSGFKYITILITADDNLRPAQFSMEEHSGVRITADLDLKKLNIGGSVNGSVFQPNWPKRAQVVPIQ